MRRLGLVRFIDTTDTLRSQPADDPTAQVVKQRMQTGEFSSLGSAIRGVVAQQGVRRGLYAGWGSLMLRDLPFDVIEFVACVPDQSRRV
eukprot:1176072-Prorocentrum_minimum.AAC.1